MQKREHNVHLLDWHLICMLLDAYAGNLALIYPVHAALGITPVDKKVYKFSLFFEIYDIVKTSKHSYCTFESKIFNQGM